LSPELLKQFLSKPELIEKLMTQHLDPAFLSNILAEDAKTDLKLLEEALGQMPPEQISETFGFNPELNLDHAKMAKIF
jgi:hypothetical protein